MTTSIKVMYTGYNPYLDKVITDALKGAGLTWYAQGNNLVTKVRDLSFDYDDGEEEGK